MAVSYTHLEEHEKYLKRFIYSHVRNTEDTKDIYQECLHNAFKSFNQLRDEKKFKSWVAAIAMNLIRKKFQKNKYTEISLEEVYEANPNQTVFRDEESNVEEIILRNQNKKDAREKIGQLSYRERVFVYYYYELEKNIEEIAGILSTKPGTLYSLHSRIKGKLRRKEGDYGTHRRKKSNKENA